jgi:hypothetical protein
LIGVRKIARGAAAQAIERHSWAIFIGNGFEEANDITAHGGSLDAHEGFDQRLSARQSIERWFGFVPAAKSSTRLPESCAQCRFGFRELRGGWGPACAAQVTPSAFSPFSIRFNWRRSSLAPLSFSQKMRSHPAVRN